MSESALEAASKLVETGDLKQLMKLLSANPELLSGRLEESEYTLLHLAAKHNQVEIAKWLLDSGAPIDAYPLKSYMPEHKGAGDGTWTPLVQALNAENIDLAKLIASRGIVPNNLWVAVGLQNMEMVKSFFSDTGKLTDEAGDPGKLQTEQDILDDAFNMACHVGSLELIDFLLGKGANISGRDHWGMTGLHWAVDCHPELVRYLVDKGADVRIRDAQHVTTPLFWALYFEKQDLADYMLEKCQIHICDAVMLGRKDLVEKIIEKEPHLVNGPLGLGEPLRVAAAKGNEELVGWLLGRGADPANYEVRPGMFDPNELEHTALGWAREKGHKNIEKKLQAAGAEK